MDALSSSVIVCRLPIPSVCGIRTQTSAPFKNCCTRGHFHWMVGGVLNECIHLYLPVPTSGNVCVGNISFDFSQPTEAPGRDFGILSKRNPCFCRLLCCCFRAGMWSLCDHPKGVKTSDPETRVSTGGFLKVFGHSRLLLHSDGERGRWLSCDAMTEMWPYVHLGKTTGKACVPWGRPLRACDGGFYEALNLRTQFKCITLPERPFHDLWVRRWQCRAYNGTNHNNVKGTDTFKYSECNFFTRHMAYFHFI